MNKHNMCNISIGHDMSAWCTVAFNKLSLHICNAAHQHYYKNIFTYAQVLCFSRIPDIAKTPFQMYGAYASNTLKDKAITEFINNALVKEL